LLEEFVMADAVAGLFGERRTGRQDTALTGRRDACRYVFG